MLDENILLTDRKSQKRKLARMLKRILDEEKQNSPMQFQATKKRSELMSKHLLRCYSNERVVAWRGSLIPSEIFYALDVVPLLFPSIPALLTMSQMSHETLDVATSEYFSTDCCSFIRTVLGCLPLDLLPTPNFIVCTNYLCDVEGKVAEIASKVYGKKHYYLEVPIDKNSNESINYLAKQIEHAMTDMAQQMNKKIDMDKLAETIEFSNEARKYFIQAMEYRKNTPCPMRGLEAIDYTAIPANTWGDKEIIDVYKLLAEEMKEKVNSGIPAIEGEKYRLLWRHLRPYYDSTLFDYLETESKAVVVMEEVNYVFWDEMDPRDPFRSLALKMLSNPAVGPMENWMHHNRRLFKEYKLDGVIGIEHWGCRYIESPSQFMKDSLKKDSVPFLSLTLDLVDKRNFSEAQAITRIDAFLEVLSQRK